MKDEININHIVCCQSVHSLKGKSFQISIFLHFIFFANFICAKYLMPVSYYTHLSFHYIMRAYEIHKYMEKLWDDFMY